MLEGLRATRCCEHKLALVQWMSLHRPKAAQRIQPKYTEQKPACVNSLRDPQHASVRAAHKATTEGVHAVSVDYHITLFAAVYRPNIRP